MSDELSSALEDYLEAILELSRGGARVRVKDIAARVGVHKSTVTAALHSLAAKNMVVYAPYESAVLTSTGADLAREIAHRHGIFRRFLRDVLGLSPERADANACRLEHAMDRACMERLLCFVEFMGSAAAGITCASAFDAYCQSRGATGKPPAAPGDPP